MSWKSEFECDNAECVHHVPAPEGFMSKPRLVSWDARVQQWQSEMRFPATLVGCSSRARGCVCLACVARADDACAVCLCVLYGRSPQTKSHGAICGECARGATGPMPKGYSGPKMYDEREELERWELEARTRTGTCGTTSTERKVAEKYEVAWRTIIDLLIARRDDEDKKLREMRAATQPLVLLGARRESAIFVVLATPKKRRGVQGWSAIAEACELACYMAWSPTETREQRRIALPPPADSSDEESEESDEPRAKRARKE